MAKKNEITVKDVSIKTMNVNGIDYICITDIAKQKNSAEPKDVVKNWMRQKNTLEYLGLWEKLNNPNFKGVEFDPLLAEAGSNAFTMSPTRWVELTSAIGIITKNGAGGGTYAQRDIAFKFANWVSVEFELYLVMEFQRLKAKEQELIGWTAKRELSKINYRIHTDAIKSNLIPEEVTHEQANIIYAEEADVLNAVARGKSRTERQHPRLCHYQRTYLPLEYGKHQCRAYQRWYASGRTLGKAQPDSHPADAGTGGEQWKESIEMNEIRE